MNSKNALVFASLTAAATAVLVACGSGSVVDVTDTSSNAAIEVIQADAALTEIIFNPTRLDSLLAFCKANPGACEGNVPSAVSSSGTASSSSTGSSSSQGGGSSSSTDTPSSSSVDSPSSSSTIGSSSSIIGSSSSSKPSSSSVASSSSSKPSSSSAASSSSVASSSSAASSSSTGPVTGTPVVIPDYGASGTPVDLAAGDYAVTCTSDRGAVVCKASGSPSVTVGGKSVTVNSWDTSLGTCSAGTALGVSVPTGTTISCINNW